VGRTLAITLIAIGGVFGLAVPALAADAPTRHVDVVQVSGWLDPVVVDFLDHAIDDAERGQAEALVLQLDSPGAVVSDARLDALVDRVAHARVPIAVWVGASRAHALRGAGRLVEAAPIAGMAPGARVDIGNRRLDPDQARRERVVALNKSEAAVIGTFIASLDGKRVGGRVLHTAAFTQPAGGGPRQARLDPDLQARLAKLDLVPRLMHTVASPPVAYLLLTAGLALLVFELFTAGIGIAGAVAAGCLVLAAYGLAVLPTSPWGLALLLVGLFGFAIDVQTGAPRIWTAIGVLAYAAGSVTLYRDPVSLGWLPLVGGVVGLVLLMLAGLPATVRSRFSTPTIGRESMLGEEGEVVATVSPEGVVRVREALWPARANRATPLAVGDRVRVVAIEGAALEVVRVD
jgi:membrane-bound serine protease (ClpP class)